MTSDKKRVAFAVAVSILATVAARLPVISAHFEARSLQRNNPVLTVLPQPLFDSSISDKPGIWLSHFGYQYEVPWGDVEKTKQGDFLAVDVLKDGEAIAFYDPASMAETEEAKIASDFFHMSDFEWTSAIFNVTPRAISLWRSSTQTSRALTLLRLKDSSVKGAESGLFSVKTSRFRGFQLGDPRHVASIRLIVFDQRERRFEIVLGTAVGKPLTMTQPDINQVLETLRSGADGPVSPTSLR